MYQEIRDCVAIFIINCHRTYAKLLLSDASLWSPYVIGQTIIFLPCSFFLLLLSSSSFFIPRLISAVTDWMSTILLHMAWPYSANLECRSEMCCTRLAANAGPNKVDKNRHLGTIPQLCRAVSF